MKNYLFLPVANIRGRLSSEPAVNDGYLLDAIQAFKNHNPATHVISSNKKLDWTKVADPASTRKVVYTESKDFKAILGNVGDGAKKKNVYVGTLRNISALESTLSVVTKADVLFVVGHGSYTSEFISRKHFYTENKASLFDVHMISMEVLAKAIERSGLPKSHVHIKFTACFGGGSDSVIPFDQSSLEGSAVASRTLAMKLGALGYRDILVGGYNYMTVHKGDALDLCMHVRSHVTKNFVMWARLPAEGPVGRNAKRRPAYAPKHITYEEDPYRIWYDAAGSVVRWNDPDPPGGYSKFEMLDAATYAGWAEYQAKVTAWEKTLKDKHLL